MSSAEERIVPSAVQCGEQLVHGDSGDGGDFVAHGVGQNEFATVNQGAAAIDDVRDITFPLGVLRGEQRLAQTRR